MAKTVYSMYDGKVPLVFDTEKHWYSINGRPVPGVTTITGMMDKSDAIKGWAIGQTIEYLRHNIKPGVPFDEVAIEQLLEEASNAHKRVLSKAGFIGSIVHSWIEGFIKGADPEMPLHESTVNGVNAFLEWHNANHVEYLASEEKIYSRKYDYAGTLDVEAVVNGERCILDIKTSNGIYDSMYMQTAAYQFARFEERKEKIPGRWIVRVDKDLGTVEPRYIPKDQFVNDFGSFLACLQLYKYRKLKKREWIMSQK